MLHYKSSLLKTISTFFYVFPLLLGWSEQQQHISVEMMDNYYEPFVCENTKLESFLTLRVIHFTCRLMERCMLV